jgi:hypothetical protein
MRKSNVLSTPSSKGKFDNENDEFENNWEIKWRTNWEIKYEVKWIQMRAIYKYIC